MRAGVKTVLLILFGSAQASAWCGLDVLGICKTADKVAKELDVLPEKVAKAAKEVLDNLFKEDLDPAIDKLTASAKALEDRAEQDVEKVINTTRVQLEELVHNVVEQVEELAKDLTKDVEEIVNTVEKDVVDGVKQILSDVESTVARILDRLERDGQELICAAQGWVDTFEKSFSSYFQNKDCDCVQSMLQEEPGLTQDCPCTSCWHVLSWYPKCSCNPWGLKFGPGWYNRGKYQFLKCHLMKGIQWDKFTVDQIVAQLAIVQESALSFRCMEDMLPGATANRDYFSAEYLNVSHTILVWKNALPSKSSAVVL